MKKIVELTDKEKFISVLEMLMRHIQNDQDIKSELTGFQRELVLNCINCFIIDFFHDAPIKIRINNERKI